MLFSVSLLFIFFYYLYYFYYVTIRFFREWIYVNSSRNFPSAVSARSRRILSVNGDDAESPIGGVRIPGTKKETGRFRGVHRQPLNHVQSAIFTYFFFFLFFFFRMIKRVSLTARGNLSLPS